MSSSAASDGADEPLRAIPVICGPTASGKSAVAMWLAQRRAITIISADSRQVYREFDRGTAKPTADERRRVPHRGIDVAAPDARFSAADWTELADRAIREAIAAKRLPVVVGGTGFYIAALFRPLWAEPPLDPERRRRLQDWLGRLETPELRRWVETLDPQRSHLGRAQLLRAVEIALLCGHPLSAMHLERRRPVSWAASYLVVDPGTELASRIARRASAMLDSGWPDEVRRLMTFVPEDAPAWKATGYRTIRDLVDGRVDRATALERVVVETRQYAKRQRTWFRHQLGPARVTRVSPHVSGWQETADRWLADLAKEPEVNAITRDS